MKFILHLLLFCFLVSCSKNEVDNGPIPDTSTDSILNGMSTPFTVLKSGKFNSSSGYPTSGTAQLIVDSTKRYSIRLDDDFSTTFATGAVTMYLSKTMNLKLTDSTTFIRLAVINKNGAYRFALQGKPAEDLSTIVVWCQPAGIKFGHADLK